MFIQNFKCGFLHNNNYVLIDEESKEALLIDCSVPSSEIMEFIKEKGAKLKAILLTHGHFDHMLGVNFYQDTFHVPVYVHKKDKELLSQINFFTRLVEMPPVEIPKITHFFDATTNFTLGQYSIKIIETPGHSMGSVCFLIQNNLFSGDTLFKATHGRTDLIGSDNQKMQKSLKTLFECLPDETKVFPGHGSPTTIGQERDLYHF